MATQYYNSQNAATYNQYYVVQELIEHAEPMQVVSKFGQVKPLPQNKTDTILFSRLRPIGYNTSTGGIDINPSSFLLAEGANAIPITIQYDDVLATVEKYGVVCRLTEKTELMNERNIPEDMRLNVAEGISSIKEMIVWNQIKGGTSVVYSNGSSRSQVNTAISVNAIMKAVRMLEAAHAKRVTSVVRAGVEYGTQAISPCFILFTHTDARYDYEKLPGWKRIEDYGSFKPVHEQEIGAISGGVRVCVSPMLKPYLGAGSSTLNGMVSVGGSNVDVYPSVVIAQGAYGHVPLKGRDAMKPFVIPATERNHANPNAQFGYVGADFYTACVRLNEFFMVRIEHGVTSL